MADVKMTKVAKFNAIADLIPADTVFPDGSSVAEFLAHEAEITTKRNSRKSSKPSKKQAENATIADQMRELLADNERMTATEIAKALGLPSPQKVVGIVRTTTGIARVSDKRVTYYTLEEAE